MQLIQKQCSCERGLTLNHTISTVSNHEKMFSPFPKTFSTMPKTNFKFWVTFNWSSARALNLDYSMDLSFGRELLHLCLALYQAYQHVVMDL